MAGLFRRERAPRSNSRGDFAQARGKCEHQYSPLADTRDSLRGAKDEVGYPPTT